MDIGRIAKYLFFVYNADNRAIESNGVKLGANGIILIKTPIIKNRNAKKYFIYLLYNYNII